MTKRPRNSFIASAASSRIPYPVRLRRTSMSHRSLSTTNHNLMAFICIPFIVAVAHSHLSKCLYSMLYSILVSTHPRSPSPLLAFASTYLPLYLPPCPRLSYCGLFFANLVDVLIRTRKIVYDRVIIVS